MGGRDTDLGSFGNADEDFRTLKVNRPDEHVSTELRDGDLARRGGNFGSWGKTGEMIEDGGKGFTCFAAGGFEAAGLSGHTELGSADYGLGAFAESGGEIEGLFAKEGFNHVWNAGDSEKGTQAGKIDAEFPFTDAELRRDPIGAAGGGEEEGNSEEEDKGGSKEGDNVLD